MPVTKRDISPVGLSRHRLPPSVRTEELECVSNGTLANLIRQLSSLSAHAEDVFGELYMETVKVQHKTAMLSGRLETLSAKVGELDSALDEPSIQEFYLCKPFKSNLAFDQQPLSRHTLPAAMSQRYERGEPPPDLEKLNGFREDGKNALKFYTDPDYFFELWRQEMLKDPENSRKVKVTAKSKNSGEKKVKQISVQYAPKSWHCEPRLTEATTDQLNSASKNERLFSVQESYAVHSNCLLVGDGHVTGVDDLSRPKSLDLHRSGGGGGGGSITARLSQDAYGNRIYAETGRIPHSRADGLPPLAEKFELVDYDSRQKTYNGHCSGDRRNRDVVAPFVSTHVPSSIDHRHGSWSTAVTVRDSDHYMCTASSSSSSVIYGTRRSPSRPTQPPPLPPTDMPDTCSRLASSGRGNVREERTVLASTSGSAFMNDDIVAQIASWKLDDVPPSMLDGVGDEAVMEVAAFRGSSLSPDLPPPPPPLTNFSLNSAVLSSSSSADQPAAVETFHCKSNANELGIGSPPPPPPPPLLMPNGSIYSGSLGGSTESSSSCSNTVGSKSSSQATGNENVSKNVTQQAAASIDTRSDLLRAIRQGIQLKKVNREEEQQRENDAVMAGHDVAAILKRRMELVRGCSESEDSASEEPDEWDD
ncbi:hypothetical protein M514_05450 [Trichuris suis]|uniref:Wiskott-Aldrich syndrome protein family member n=1 Tax=Trichuris suis TaxID=68888 RepID=A0A085NSL8_9BILA|nr:hypothetical protein M514_05450 [Trichuris suis]